MADEAGIKIDGKHYAIPSSLRVGETRTIKRATGLNPPEFMAALADLHKTQDPDVGAAMVWWIVHREDPSFTLDQVDELEWSAIEGEDGEAAPVVDPKAPSEIESSSPTSASVSSPTWGMPGTPVSVGETIPASGGDLALVHSGQST